MGRGPMRPEMCAGAEGDEVRRIRWSSQAHPAVAVLNVIQSHHLEDVRPVRAAQLVTADVAGIEDRGDTALVAF